MDGGKLSIQLRNKRTANKRPNDTNNCEDMLDEKDAKEVFEQLKATVVQNDSLNDIKLKLRSTLTYRGNILKNIEINLRECFPYFFVSPELVNFNYLNFDRCASILFVLVSL